VGANAEALLLLEDDVADIARQKPPTRVPILINHALAHAQAGDFEAAFDSATRATVAAHEAKGGLSAMADPTYSATQLDADSAAANWLWAALAARTKNAADALKVLGDTPDAANKTLVEWLELSVLPEEKRRPMRWNVELAEPVTLVLPAVMYLVSQAVPQDMDVDVWLDRIFHDVHRTDPVMAMLARVEAARWRGDLGSAEMWAKRAARMRSLYDDYRSTLLAHIADLR
jgi:hypothetical protein